MKDKTRQVFDRLENQRGKILELYGSLSSEQLKFKPEPENWNLLQVLRHLVTAEQQSMNYIQRKAKRGDTIEKTGIGAVIRHVILKTALLLPIKFKAPKVADVSGYKPNLKTMISEWEAVRKEMKAFIENSSSEELSTALYKHPRAGMLNVKQALEFMVTHISHHQKQMQKLINMQG